MRITRAEAKINGVHVAEAKIHNDPHTTPIMSANYALVSHLQDGKISTHGKCHAFPNNWSEKTKQCVKDLLVSMEEDLIAQHFKMSADKEEDNAQRLGFGAVEEAPQI